MSFIKYVCHLLETLLLKILAQFELNMTIDRSIEFLSKVFGLCLISYRILIRCKINEIVLSCHRQ